MEKIKIGIVLLNYNTAEDVKNAIRSIGKFTHIPYRICVVDNNSSKEDRAKLRTIGSQIVDILYVDKNEGYGSGNNQGAKYLQKKYSPPYMLIMNPDVSIINDYTIDFLIEKLEKQDKRICGIQPLIWTPRLGNDPRYHCNIRAVKDYWDCCISSFHPLQFIFRKRYNNLIYDDLKPYDHDVFFEVPAGCFFIIKSSVFEDVGFFDSRTFLYNEEYILGYKLKEKGYSFLFDVSQTIQHEQGISTGEHKIKVSPFFKKCQKQSLCIYLKYYLKVSFVKIHFIFFLINLNYIGKYFKYNILR